MELCVEDNVCNAAISICQVPGRGLFCYGNHPGKGTAYILQSEYSIEKLESGPPYGNISPALYEDSIYLFGGWDSTGLPFNKAIKYSLQNNNWSTLSDLKVNLSFVSNIVTNEGILLVGYQSAKLYRYDIESDSYFELASFVASTWKILCNSSNRSFLIESSGNIYENNPRWLSNWIAIQKFTDQISRAPLTYYATYEDSAYFLDEACNFFRFNFNSLTLSKVITHK
ncbi:unnamed protein product [Blepharisma stoltei]|uniref:Uncharacterized protein n=1 Tax=Blepharisma stoltei TaxID=1481888 RepID=A0AAU9JWY4_9CILI|nr:unnamed protein product [Blepharisma stoltei]